MKENVNKLFVRGDHLDELNERSENLRSAADDFHSASSRFLLYTHCATVLFLSLILIYLFLRLRKNMWWKEMRTRLILGSLCMLIVIIMIGKND